MFLRLKMWNQYHWSEDPSWFNLNPYAQYTPSVPPQQSVPPHQSPSSQCSVLPQELGPPQSTSSRTSTAGVRSLTPSPVSFCGGGSVSTDSEDGPSSHSSVNSGNMIRRRMWSKEEVLALLDIYGNMRDDFKDPKKRNKDIWETIGKEMEKLGFNDKSSPGDCESKFKNLKRAYTNTVDHNNTSGNDRKTCAYFDELNALFEKDVRIKPVAVCSSRAGTKKPTESSCDKDATCSESESDDVPKKRKRKSKAGDDLLTLFKDFTKTREEREKERMQELKEMHTEKMAMMGRFLQVFERSVDKSDSSD